MDQIITVKMLAQVSDWIDQYIEVQKTSPLSTPKMVEILIEAQRRVIDNYDAQLYFALMLATAIQRLSGPV